MPLIWIDEDGQRAQRRCLTGDPQSPVPLRRMPRSFLAISTARSPRRHTRTGVMLPTIFAAFFRGEVQKWARVVKEGRLALIDD